MTERLTRRLRPTIASGIVWAGSRIGWWLRRRRSAEPPAGYCTFTRQEILSELCHWFDRVALRQIATEPGLVDRLIGRFLRARGLRFAVNIAPGMGHNTLELDRVFRAMAIGDAPRRLGLLRRPTQIHRDTLALYRNRFPFASQSDLLVDWLYPVIAHDPRLRMDFGLSRLKWHPRDDGTCDPVPSDGQNYLHQVSKAENRRTWAEYYRLRRRTMGRYPLADGIVPDQELLDFLGGRPKKLALVHLKYHVANATAAASDPGSYLTAIEWLQDNGYLVVQVGLEPRPEALRIAGVLNYAESRVASYKHDLQIFSMASVAITAGSGLACVPDCMGVPYVYLDSWHIGMPMPSERCIIVPALVDERATGRRLSFAEQHALYWDLADHGDEIFPYDRYRGRNASADEVLAALQEALALAQGNPPLTGWQLAYRDIDRDGLGGLTMARVSNYFLDKHAALLDSPHCSASIETGVTRP